MNARLILGVAAMTMAWPAAAQAADYGRARITLTVPARCGVARLLHRVQLNPDGTFAFTVTIRHRVRENRSIRQRARLAMSGQVVGAAASGTAAARIVQRRGGRVIARCSSGQRAWQARAAAAEATAGAPVPSGAYHGLTGQSGRPRS